MPFYERGPVRIHYQETGSGFPLFIIPGGQPEHKTASHFVCAVFNPDAPAVCFDDSLCDCQTHACAGRLAHA